MGVTTVRLQPEVEAALEAMAGKLHRSENGLIDQAAKVFVFRQDEDQARWKDTLAAMESVAGGNAISGESVHAWLRSWGQSDELPPPGVGQ